MADLTKSADQLIAEVTEVVKKGLNARLAPILNRMADAARELQAAVGGAAPTSGPRRGRRPGRPAGKAKAAAVAAAPPKKRGPKPRKAGKGGKRNPRGALQGSVRSTLTSAGGALTLSEIRDVLLKSSMFAGRDAKTLYTQIVQSIKKMPDVRKTAAGKYGLKAGGPGKKATRRG